MKRRIFHTSLSVRALKELVQPASRLFVCLFLGVTAIGRSFESPSLSSGHVKLGMVKFDKKDYDGAITEFSAAIRLDPFSARAYWLRGNAKTGESDFDGAISDFNIAIRIRPTFASAYFDRAFAKTMDSDLDGAIEDFNEVIRLRPLTPEAFEQRGYAKRSKGDKAGFEEDTSRAATLYNDVGARLFTEGRIAEAISFFGSSASLAPDNAAPYYNRALAEMSTQDYAEVIADCSIAIRLDPKMSAAYVCRARVRMTQKSYIEAIADYTEAIRLNQTKAQYYGDRARAKLAVRNISGAIEDWEEAIALDPNDANAYNSIAWQLAVARDDAIRNGLKALTYSRKACTLTQWKDANFCDTFAAACAATGHFDEAIKWETKVLDSNLSKQTEDDARARLSLYRQAKLYREAD